MHKFITLCFIFLASFFTVPLLAEPLVKSTIDTTDHRQLVTMPEQARSYMRLDMLEHLAALNEIISLLADKNLNAVAEVAENRMGRSSMGKYRSTGMGPGRFMTLEMRNVGWSMHDAATELATHAEKGDLDASYTALQKITTACVICHNTYRTK